MPLAAHTGMNLAAITTVVVVAMTRDDAGADEAA